MDRTREVFAQLSSLPEIDIVRDAPLSRYTRFGIGGPADVLVVTRRPDAFVEAFRIARASGLEIVVIGGGTNLIVADEGFRGVVLKLANDGIRRSERTVFVDGGVVLQNLVDFTVGHGLRGLETMTGIPGFTGAAIYGNAGAYGHSISERVTRVTFFDGAEIRDVDNAGCEFHYRESVFKRHRDLDCLFGRARNGCGRPGCALGNIREDSRRS